MQQVNPRMSAISSRTSQFYDKWASSPQENYDESSVKFEFTSPQQLVKSTLALEGRVLDLGCGTGAVGKLLKGKNAMILIDGVDCALGMLRRAPAGVHRKLIHAQIEDAHLKLKQAEDFKEYDAIVSCGVFGDYVHPSFLANYLDFLKSKAQVSIAGSLENAWSGKPSDIENLIPTILSKSGFVVNPVQINVGYKGQLGEVKYAFIHATRS